MSYHCPNCSEVIHDRTRKVCGICGTALPGGLLLRMAQAEASHKEAAEAAEGQKRERESAQPEGKAK